MASVELRRISKTFDHGPPALDNLELAVDDGEFAVMVGPSGCGKSTALRILAGLEQATAGEVLIDGQPVGHLAPQQRNIAMVFQNYALYPHKTIRANMEFPLRMMGLPAAERRARIARTSAMLGLDDLLDRRPRQLSGGQRQRAAMARALVRDPAVSLMDEPLSNLDAKLRVEIRAEIAALQRRTRLTTIYVTHDQVEAMTLGHRVAVLDHGKLQQFAPPQTIYDRPANTFVAGFIGSPPMNLWPTRVRREGNRLSVALGTHWLPVPPDHPAAGAALAAAASRPDGGPVIAGLRPEAFHLRDQAAETPRLPVVVSGRESLGHELIVTVQIQPGHADADAAVSGDHRSGPAGKAFAARLPAGPAPAEGRRMELAVRMKQLHLFNPDGGAL